MFFIDSYILFDMKSYNFSNDIYNDYDILNEFLEQKYDVNIPKSIQKKDDIYWNTFKELKNLN